MVISCLLGGVRVDRKTLRDDQWERVVLILSNSCRARPVTRVLRPRTIGGLLRPSSGSCGQAVFGATCQSSSGIGTGRMYVSPVDARRTYLSALPKRCVVTLTWSTYSLIRPSCAPTSIPPRSNRLTQRSFDRHLYRDRNLIERFFARLKHFRRIAMRYDKLASSFLSFVHLPCAFIWLA